MGERKAVNKYYPPDWDPSKGGLDKYHGSHPLRERASKLHLGILVIRFEMPFNMWCGGCNNHIGMGVRYNAEKKKIGKYYTTPIWQFRMKCHLCDNYIEIHTDPKNFDYIVASGGRRKEERYKQDDAECAAAHDAEERKRINVDPMYKLEYKGKDEQVIEEAEPVINKLQDSRNQWADDYKINQTLRKRFREETNDDRIANKRLKEQFGLAIRMKPTSKNDKLTSSLVRFTTEKNRDSKRKRTELASIFDDNHRKAASILTSLKHAGVRCVPDLKQASKPKHLVRRKSSESTTTTAAVTSPTQCDLKSSALKRSHFSGDTVVPEDTFSVKQCDKTTTCESTQITNGDSQYTVVPLAMATVSAEKLPGVDASRAVKEGTVCTAFVGSSEDANSSSTQSQSCAGDTFTLSRDNPSATVNTSSSSLVQGYSSSGSDTDIDKESAT